MAWGLPFGGAIPKPSTDLLHEPMCHGEMPDHELSIATAAWKLLLGLQWASTTDASWLYYAPPPLNHLQVLIFLV